MNIEILRSSKYVCAYCNDQNIIEMQRTSKFIPLCEEHIKALKAAIDYAVTTAGMQEQ